MKDQIIHYMLDGMFLRALERSQASMDLRGSIQFYQKDRPYLFAYPDSDRYFDFKKIDKFSHRVFTYNGSQMDRRKITDLYNSGKMRDAYELLLTDEPASEAVQ
jgi:hypothetical protein